ncbi:OsmC family protein [Primorskyibacter aestuariivivens]|uniref:OsmC family protein n=1 Tax=Primorskyibacter aestuariivivens TaxID=1888912 RepID=UPI002301E6DD|nr:OsmC family protein [Primorskyibacter aestuariivivens]MDA7430443.1 OsmC family protein [Primorskyibacter aestuariivivens]
MTDALFNVHFSAEGVCVGKLRNEVSLTAHEPFQVQRMLATDEGKFQGGEDTAPTPLEFFLTGLVGCLMTQIRVFAKRLKVDVEDVKVTCRARWEAHPDPVGPYQGKPVGFEIDVDVTSGADPARVSELVGAARRGCFVEQTLSQANEITHHLTVNGAEAPRP